MSQKTLELVLTSEIDTKALANKLASASIKGSVWLSGDLGSGKTTLTRYWLKALGHKGAVKSPTYTLVEPYEIAVTDKLSSRGIQQVYHADLYRLQDPEELSFIGFEEYLADDEALVIIEWASRADDYLPDPVMTIDIIVSNSRAANKTSNIDTSDTKPLDKAASDSTVSTMQYQNEERRVMLTFNADIKLDIPV